MGECAFDKDELLDGVGKSRYKAVFTITLAELVDAEIFDWKNDDLNWITAAYDEEQYERVCAYFIERFKYREISMKPYKVWAQFLHRKLAFEIMPKYRPLYKAVADGFTPLASDDEIYKERTVNSKYPQTLLGGNADYATEGDDREYERLHYEDPLKILQEYAQAYHGIDEMLLDELECMFIGLYNANVNLW